MKWISQASLYESWLKSISGKRATDLKKEECTKCGYCCAMRPCIPTPKELKEISKFLKMKTNEMIKKYFVCDSFNWCGPRFIFPAKESQLDITGTYIDSSRTYDKGYCVFFDKKKKECKIYSVRPKHAKESSCWINTNGDITKNVLEEWKGVNCSKFGIEN
jgi:Fe-S-cluster containining protein